MALILHTLHQKLKNDILGLSKLSLPSRFGQVPTLKLKLKENMHTPANLKNILVSPYPTLFNRYGSVGRNFFLTSQIGYPLNLIVYIVRPVSRGHSTKGKKLFYQD